MTQDSKGVPVNKSRNSVKDSKQLITDVKKPTPPPAPPPPKK